MFPRVPGYPGSAAGPPLRPGLRGDPPSGRGPAAAGARHRPRAGRDSGEFLFWTIPPGSHEFPAAIHGRRVGSRPRSGRRPGRGRARAPPPARAGRAAGRPQRADSPSRSSRPLRPDSRSAPQQGTTGSRSDLDDLSDEAVARIVARGIDRPSDLTLGRPLAARGAMSRVPADATAFGRPRDHPFLLEISLSSTSKPSGMFSKLTRALISMIRCLVFVISSFACKSEKLYILSLISLFLNLRERMRSEQSSPEFYKF